MKLYTIVPLLLATLLCAEPLPESSSLSSSSADYDGNSLQLKGKVILDHGLGQMNAEEASLQRQESGKDFPFSLIHLQKDVLLKLPNQAEIKCDSADFDFNALKGILHSIKNKVRYTDNLNQKGLLCLVSDQIDLDLLEKGHDGKKTNYALKTILATGDLIVDYAEAFTLRAERARYKKEASTANEWHGVVSVHPKENSLVHLVHAEDWVDADSVDLDLVHSQLLLHKPQGTLLSPLVPQQEKSELSFTANELTWNHLKNSLTLQGKIHIEERSLGTIEAEEMLTLTQALVKGKRLLQSIRTQGKALFTYQDSNKTEHRLVTHGPLFLDREHLRLSIESPDDEEAQQIHYEEAEIAIQADRAVVEYALVGNLLQPVSLNLKGAVRLSSRDAQKGVLCGISDRVTYSPETRTLILAADPGKKVLFWDEVQRMRMTSQEIHVTQDAVTKERSVKGVGKVSFAFTTEESSLLKKLFPDYKEGP